MRAGYSIVQDKVLIDFSSLYCETSEKLLSSILFKDVLHRYLKRLKENESPIYDHLKEALDGLNEKEIQKHLIIVLRLLNTHRTDEIIEINIKYKSILKKKFNEKK